MKYFFLSTLFLMIFNISMAYCNIPKDKQDFPLENKWDKPILIPQYKPGNILVFRCYLNGKITNVIPLHTTVQCYQSCVNKN